MRRHGVGIQACRRVHHEHLAEQVRQLRRCARDGWISTSHHILLLRRERRGARHHVIKHTSQAPNIHLRIVRLGFHQSILHFHWQVHHFHLRKHLSLTLVVACDFERSIESSSGTVVQQSIAHQVQDVLKVHLANIPAIHRFHDPFILHTRHESLSQRISGIPALLDHLQNARTLVVGTWLVLPDAEGSLLELNLQRGLNLRGIGGVEVVSPGDDHLGRHILQGADEFARLQWSGL
mmetsp:Transcript_42447/g.92187  ORF Transcript_42447/g.92187 Transcript_42447/m.92187 type:complete len:236 (+) Transcript_42447:97-804(+)